MIMKLFI